MPTHAKRTGWAYAMSAVLAVLALIALMNAPAVTSAPFLAVRMLGVHLVLELFAIVIAVLVVMVSWHTFEVSSARASNLFMTGFVVVAVCDFLHALTYEGMPTFLTVGRTDRAIFFWLMGRSFEVGTLGLVALTSVPWMSRRVSLAAGLLVSAVLVWYGSYHIDGFPQTFVAGVGVTAFKARYEYVLCALNLMVAALLWRRAAQSGQAQYQLLAASSFLMGIGELAFTSYVAPSDFQTIFGHVFKLVAYGLLYRATFIFGMKAPFAALRASEAQLRESETRLRKISDNLPQCMVYQLAMDPDGARHFIHVSAAVERLNGLRVDDVLRDASLLYAQVHADDVPRLLAAEQRALESLQVFDVTARLRRTDGALRHMRLISAPRPVEGGRVLWDGIEVDVTDTQQAEDARRVLEGQLLESQKMESLGTLASGVAHDFNNILGSILGNLALALEDLEHGKTAEVPRNLLQVRKASLRARALVQQILTFGRRQVTRRSIQALRPIVDEALAMLHASLPAKVAVEAYLTDAPTFVLADATQIEQVALNLCMNAWQSMGDAGGRIEVRLDLAELTGDAATRVDLPAGRYARLQVTDNGCGMDAATCARAFEPFFTTKPKGQGTGLGLSVVHGIVRTHEGAIAVRSEPGFGSTFEVYLPLAATPPAEAQTGASARKDQERTGSGERVMYIDDDEVMSLMVEQLLGRAGYVVTCHRDPVGALQRVRDQPDAVDLVVTDFNMPTQSGLDVVRALAEIRPGLPVVLTSGSVTQELRSAARGLGVASVIEKQNTLEELAATIGRVLASRLRNPSV